MHSINYIINRWRRKFIIYKGLTLDLFQEQAYNAIQNNQSIIVSAPTGAGKTIVAQFAIDKAIEENRGVIYTSPLKALSNQKFRDFKNLYTDKVGILTGDIGMNSEAQIVIMTTEVFRNIIFQTPERLSNYGYVIFDEIHYIDNEERGTVWEESIIFAPKSMKFICLSATIPNIENLADWIESVRGEKIIRIREDKRPVPLHHTVFFKGIGFINLKDLSRLQKDRTNKKSLDNKKNTIFLLKEIFHLKHYPILFFVTSRRMAEELAVYFATSSFLSAYEDKSLAADFCRMAELFNIHANDRTAQKLARIISSGICYHHAGLLPHYKEIIEQLFSSGQIKLLFTTETFALGVNMPAQTVVFNEPEKFDGIQFNYLKTREYNQMAGRAGRRGIDDIGYVYMQVEPKNFNKQKILNMMLGKPEPVSSQFNISYSTLLNLYKRYGQDYSGIISSYFGSFVKKIYSRSFVLEKFYLPKMQVLARLNYLDRNGLLPKGNFAANINGYELQLTEMYFQGLFENIDEPTINVLIASIIYESRRNISFIKLKERDFLMAKNNALRLINKIRDTEKENNCPDIIRSLDFKASAAVYYFSKGESFGNLKKFISLDDGDMVRIFRLVIQLLKQWKFIVYEEKYLYSKLNRCMELINRDEVDAEKQLKIRLDEL